MERIGLAAGVLVFIGIVVIVIVLALKQKRENAAAAAQLGFTPLKKPDPALIERLKAMYIQSRTVRIADGSEKRIGDQQVYLMNIYTSGQGDTESSLQDSRAVVIVSTHLNLPGFMLICRMPSLGPLGGLLNQMITSGAAMTGYKEWEYVIPEFSSRYMLFTKGEEGVREVFTEAAQTRFAGVENYIVRGLNDTLVFNTYDIRRGVKLDAAGLQNHVDKARQVCAWLGD